MSYRPIWETDAQGRFSRDAYFTGDSMMNAVQRAAVGLGFDQTDWDRGEVLKWFKEQDVDRDKNAKDDTGPADLPDV